MFAYIVVPALVVAGLAVLLNSTVFREQPASKATAWVLTGLVALVSIPANIKWAAYIASQATPPHSLQPHVVLLLVPALLATIFIGLLRREKMKALDGYTASAAPSTLDPSASTLTRDTTSALAPEQPTRPRPTPAAAATTPVAGKANFAIPANDHRAVESVHVATAPLPPAAITDQEAQAIEDESYAAAWDEVEQGNTDRGTWAKAFAQTGGEEAKMRAAYLNLRVPRLVEARREELIKKKNRERAEALVREKRKRAEAEARAERQRNEAMAQAQHAEDGAQLLEERLQAFRAEHPTPPEADILTFRNDAGKTALRIAVDACSEDRVIRLLAWGADPLVADSEGVTPLAAAVSAECLKVAEILRAAEDSARRRAELRKAEMDRYGITYDGRAWRYKDFRYKSLEDAVKFAIWEDRHGPVDAT